MQSFALVVFILEAWVLTVLFSHQGELHENLPRIMHWMWRPDHVMEAVEAGVDLFDSSYPFQIQLAHLLLGEIRSLILLRLFVVKGHKVGPLLPTTDNPCAELAC